MNTSKTIKRLALLVAYFLLSKLNLSAQNTFKKEWKEIDSLVNTGLTQSALTKVDAIYTQAKKNNYSTQLAKSLIYKIKLLSFKEENALQQAAPKQVQQPSPLNPCYIPCWQNYIGVITKAIVGNFITEQK
jgi:hypothetical protein